jgi:ferredoxin-NADP reductase
MPQELTGKVIQTKDISPNNKHITIQVDPSFTFLPGQYVFFVLEREGRALLRAYSIASSPHHKGLLEFCVTRVENGFASTYLHNLNVGDDVKLKGPFGKFVLHETPQDILFIATGSGVAPFRSMINFALANKTKKKLQLLFGVRHEEGILYHDEWEELKKNHPNFTTTITLSKPTPTWHGEQGYVQTKLDRFKPEHLDVYICGLGAMVNEVRAALAQRGCKEEHVYFERYD